MSNVHFVFNGILNIIYVGLRSQLFYNYDLKKESRHIKKVYARIVKSGYVTL